MCVHSDFVMIYDPNSYSEEEIYELSKIMEKQGFSLTLKKEIPPISASIEIFFPYLQVLASPEMQEALMMLAQGVAVNACWDMLKVFLKNIYDKFSRALIYRIQGEKIKKENANIHFVVGKNILVLPVSVDEEKYEYTVDKFMEVSLKTTPAEVTYTYYDEEKQAVVIKTQENIIKDKMKKHTK